MFIGFKHVVALVAVAATGVAASCSKSLEFLPGATWSLQTWTESSCKGTTRLFSHSLADAGNRTSTCMYLSATAGHLNSFKLQYQHRHYPVFVSFYTDSLCKKHIKAGGINSFAPGAQSNAGELGFEHAAAFKVST
ncbi:hypothetical protein BV22DRAFT_1038906 [Leucogyrophana mollusca]|uniref:Uncharacterized protein n=1 Tax=Leucogyrophana mollusca TaxID=85980 RepID=A0ACB8B5Z2_9AGAM|nr:hypothetical protein BV22DRAFT_1038906 [Leucogyrophana mollusca]